MNVAFRPFTAADQGELEGMVLALYRDDRGGQPMTVEKVRATVTELQCHPERGKVVVFELDGVTTGYAILINFWSNEYGGEWINVDELYVKSEWRGRGIGRRFLESLAVKPGENERGIQLEVMPGNRRALELYGHLGFEPAANTFLQKTF